MRLADPRKGSVYSDEVTTFSGGAGLLSTASDYFQFTEMIRRRGQGPGGPLLQPETIVDMTRNQLPGDLASMGQGMVNEISYDGIGFGLGFSVVIDPQLIGYTCVAGEVAWGGLASTAFWIDPTNDLTVSFFTQLAPSDFYPIRWDLRDLVYQALMTDRRDL
jgi:CubicO group peptidase (beta-lactamase class C family)